MNVSLLTAAPQSWEGSRGYLNVCSCPTIKTLSQGRRTNKKNRNVQLHSYRAVNVKFGGFQCNYHIPFIWIC